MLKRKSKISDWEIHYQENEISSMPWYSAKLDQDLKEELKLKNIQRGKFLDLGSGPGTQAFELSKLGFDVIATDISTTAMQLAASKFQGPVYVYDDILNSALKSRFNYIFDRGCFHTIHPDDHLTYIRAIRKLLVENGLLFLKCFSVDEPGINGPYRFSKKLIREIFEKEMRVDKIKETVFLGKRITHPKALFSVIKNV